MEIWFLGSAILVILLLVDDALIDVLSLSLGLKPRRFFTFFSKVDTTKIPPLPLSLKNAPPIAIIVANWQEAGVLPAMVRANSPLFADPRVHLFLGVYPNDLATKRVAREIAKAYPQVQVIVNREIGPTYKGQMLDELIDGALDAESTLGMAFEGFLIHDSEDLIDPASIAVYRSSLVDKDFIQIPVLSLPLSKGNWVGGTYMDEFAESHSKDMLVRQRMGAAIPSAGVGTCLRRNLVQDFRNLQGGKLFPKSELTEDYVLGQRAFQKGYQSTFVCGLQARGDGDRLIATRELFPMTIRAAIRQKSRWSLGIAFQGWQELKWFGSFWQRYFLWRDRKSILIPFVAINSLLALVALVFFGFSEIKYPLVLRNLIYLQCGLVAFRILMRMRWVFSHHGAYSALTVPLRWPVATFINTCAGLVAFVEFLKIKFLKVEVKWKKTEHQFPAFEEPRSSSQNRGVVL